MNKMNMNLPVISKFDRIMGFISFVVISFTLLVAIIFLSISFYPIDPIDIKVPIVITNPDKRVSAGDYVYYKFYYCKNVDETALVSTELIDGIVINYPSYVTNFIKGCGTSELQLLIPVNTIPGPKKIRFIMKYTIFGFREITETFESEYFDVVN